MKGKREKRHYEINERGEIKEVNSGLDGFALIIVIYAAICIIIEADTEAAAGVELVVNCGH